jgi:hypothetical protein
LKDYACPVTGLGMSEEDVKIKHRADVYYFNVDIKFIIKARMCKGCEFGKEK